MAALIPEAHYIIIQLMVASLMRPV